ncbi:hypothetical protein FHS89_000745 [Rubricella aquisinus]|uniref:Uncharacterized protein n=1 Tax=Rubricella aquisinus TaxID=2028108 RepID=A0A840WHZ4_9RHOB|nr:hypothetical protein [Rubricella aquisinus]MBB5514739.1 hypothetical protein [Rubricella aquisinus]
MQDTRIQESSEFSRHMMNFYGSYHNHKENVCLSIIGLEGAFFVGFYILGSWPPDIQELNDFYMISLFTVTWLIFHIGLRFNLRNKRLAAVITAAAGDTLMKVQQESVTYINHPSSGYIGNLVDTFLFPVPGAFRLEDMDVERVVRAQVKPSDSELDRYRYHLAKHKYLSRSRISAYALPSEYLLSTGSIGIFIIAIFRVLLT